MNLLYQLVILCYTLSSTVISDFHLKNGDKVFFFLKDED